MDLGAFLQPGRIYPFTAEVVDVELLPAAERAVWGRLLVRSGGRLTWALPVEHPAGRRLDLVLTVAGLSQDHDGSLRPAEHPEALLDLRLLAMVTACRAWPPAGGRVLRLKLLGRLIGN